MRTMTRRALRGSAVVLATLMVAPVIAVADTTQSEDLPEPTKGQLAKSVHVWDPTRGVHTWKLKGAVSEVEQVETKDEETTITLSTDILFTPDSSTLPGTAAQRIEKLVKDVPKGARIRIDGHTDSVKGKVDNQKLSTDRAKSVATVVSTKRPDLKTKVAGHADTQPVEREDPKDPSTRAANRRVEITYHG